jgi:hypothetical protein
VFWTGYKQIHERQQLRNRPWKEDLLHFGIDGRLHGHIHHPTTAAVTAAPPTVRAPAAPD